jgi:hypothetical protein
VTPELALWLSAIEGDKIDAIDTIDTPSSEPPPMPPLLSVLSVLSILSVLSVSSLLPILDSIFDSISHAEEYELSDEAILALFRRHETMLVLDIHSFTQLYAVYTHTYNPSLNPIITLRNSFEQPINSSHMRRFNGFRRSLELRQPAPDDCLRGDLGLVLPCFHRSAEHNGHMNRNGQDLSVSKTILYIQN